jgi:LasA protease
VKRCPHFLKGVFMRLYRFARIAFGISLLSLGLLNSDFASVRADDPTPPPHPIVTDAATLPSTPAAPPLDTTPRAVPALIDSAYAQTVETVTDDLSGGVSVGDLYFGDDWAFGISVIRAPEGVHGSPWGYLFLARQTVSGWDVRLETEDGFGEWLMLIPDGLIPGSGRATLIDAAAARRNATRGDGSSQLSLPWGVGGTWALTGGPHICCGSDTTGRGALDFAGGDRLVRAAREGTAWRVCSNFVRIDHPDGWQTGYYHMPNETIQVSNGQSVTRGQYIGNQGDLSGCEGHAIGVHVHFSLRRNGTPQSWHDHDLGGWNVRAGAAEYQGCMVRNYDGLTRCQGSDIYNEGMIGSGFQPLPFDTNVVSNPNFDSGTANWWTWGSVVNPGVSNGMYQWYRAANSADWAVVGQHINYSAPADSLVELSAWLGNTSGVPKRIDVVLRDAATWDGAITCAFYLPPNTPSSLHIARGRVPVTFGRLQIEFGSHSPDGQGYHTLDTVSLRRVSAPNLAATECDAPATGLGRGLRADWYNNADLTAHVTTAITPRVNAMFGGNSPISGVDVNTYSVSYTGWVQPRFSGTYTFYTLSDDGVRLWVDNQAIINNWTDHDGTWDQGNIALTAGRMYPIRLDYFQNGGGALLALQWSGGEEWRMTIPPERLFPAVNAISNGGFASMSGWGTFADPPSAITTQTNGGVLQFTRAAGSVSAVVLQNTNVALPANIPFEASFQLGNTGTARKRITVIAHDGDFSDLHVCTFWLAANAPLRTYTMRATPTEDWANASLSFYASTAGGNGAYQVDNVTLNHAPAAPARPTLCGDPSAPAPTSGANSATLITNGTFANGMTGWGTFASPANGIVNRISGGAFEFYRTTNAGSAVVLQNTTRSITANTPLEAQFQVGNSSAIRKRFTAILHDGDWSDLQVCTFWLPPNTALGTVVMRTFTTEAWSAAHLSLYASSADGAGWYRVDNVSLIRRPALAITGTECYPAGTAPADLGMDDPATSAAPLIVPTAIPMVAPYVAPGMAGEQPLIAPLAPPTENTTGEGAVSE